VLLNAAGSRDPDGNSVAYKWWHYKDAGTYKSAIIVDNANSEKAFFTIPENGGAGTIHIILQVTDNGKPQLTSYRRIIITVK
ncbi:MAG TPA: hypothetical protein VF610_11160, partial [Segetibacter sp.]